MSYQKLSRDQIAERVAQDIPDGAYVNLGIGLPTKISNYLPADKDVFLHSENGLLAFGPPPAKGEEDPELINAGKEYVTMLTGGCFFHHGDSFAMMRGGHLDIAVLGAFQVAANGDLANWHTGAADAIPAVGGAMDLAKGAKRLVITMTHTNPDGSSKIVPTCTLPLTASGVVHTLITDLAVFAFPNGKLTLLELMPGATLDEVKAKTSAPFDIQLANL